MKSAYRIAGIALVLLLLAGCATARRDLAAAGEYSLHIVPGSLASVTTAKVFRDQETLVVAGTVRKPHEFRLPGKVHVVIYDPSGALFAEADPAITNYASQKGGMKTARFSARFAQIPPAGSTVRLQYLDAASRQ